MKREEGSHGGLRKRIVSLFYSGEDAESILRKLGSYPPKRLVAPVISCLYHVDPLVRWKAVSVFGPLMARLAEEDMEGARMVIRRLMWSLNDESGGIGWGAPEAMAEAMVHHPVLAEEYVQILISYVREDGNFLEYPPLRKGAIWGLARLARERPELLERYDAGQHLGRYLEDEDPEARALALLALVRLGHGEDRPALRTLATDKTPVVVFWDGRLQRSTIEALAQEALGLQATG